MKELTVVLLTYNRRWRYVRRQIQYWATQDAYLIILDQENKKPLDAERLPDNVRYINCPGLSYIERLKLTEHLVHTEFVMMINDDDIKFMGVAERCMLELKKDKSLIACNGAYTFFTVRRNTILSLLAVTEIDSRNDKNCLLEPRVRDSMKCLFTDSVFRTCAYKKCIEILTDHPSPSAFVFTFQLMAAFLGNWKQLNELMWMRSYESPSASLIDGIDRQFMLCDWTNDPEYENEVKRWIESVSVSIANNLERKKIDTIKLVELALREWCEQELRQKPTVFTNFYKIRFAIRNFFSRKFSFLYRFLRVIKYRYFPVGVPLYRQLEWLRSRNIYVSKSNIDLIREMINQSK